VNYARFAAITAMLSRQQSGNKNSRLPVQCTGSNNEKHCKKTVGPDIGQWGSIELHAVQTKPRHYCEHALKANSNTSKLEKVDDNNRLFKLK